jgi:spore coat polysaccharide biosynthesis protein SpsF (cytidylyltransferase family)
MAKFNHVSTYTFSAEADYSHYRLTLDEPDDYKAITAIYGEFSNSLAFTYDELIKKLKQKPELADINKHVEQKSV